IATQVVGRALNLGRDAAGRQRRIDPAHRIRGAGRAAGGDTRVVGARSGGGGVGRGDARAGGHADHGTSGGGARGGPAAAVAARGTVVVHGRGGMVRVVCRGRRRVIRT